MLKVGWIFKKRHLRLQNEGGNSCVVCQNVATVFRKNGLGEAKCQAVYEECKEGCVLYSV